MKTNRAKKGHRGVAGKRLGSCFRRYDSARIGPDKTMGRRRREQDRLHGCSQTAIPDRMPLRHWRVGAVAVLHGPHLMPEIPHFVPNGVLGGTHFRFWLSRATAVGWSRLFLGSVRAVEMRKEDGGTRDRS